MEPLPDLSKSLFDAFSKLSSEKQSNYDALLALLQKLREDQSKCLLLCEELRSSLESHARRISGLEEMAASAKKETTNRAVPDQILVETLDHNTELVSAYLEELQALRKDYQSLWQRYEMLHARLASGR